MKCSDIILFMRQWLPMFTDKVSDVTTPDAVSVSGTTVTVTKAAHGRTTGEIITVLDAEAKNPISNIDDSGDTVVFTTSGNHGLTFGFGSGNSQTTTVKLSSATDPGIDGTYTAVAVPNRKSFELASFPDALLTDVILNEVPRAQAGTVGNINGIFTVTVSDADTYTYQLASAGATDPAVDPSTVSIHAPVRISGGESIERIWKSYEEQPKDNVWAFVVLGDTTTSKDRDVPGDSILEQGGANEWNAQMPSPFNVYLFVPCKDSVTGKTTVSGRAARDLCEVLRAPLYNTLIGTSFDSGFAEPTQSAVGPLGDGFWDYRKAYYIHEYRFSQTAVVTDGDVFRKDGDVPLRDMRIESVDVFNENNNILSTADLDLDNEPV